MIQSKLSLRTSSCIIREVQMFQRSKLCSSVKVCLLQYKQPSLSSAFHTSSALVNKLVRKDNDLAPIETPSDVSATPPKSKTKFIPKVHFDKERVKRPVETYEEKSFRLKSDVYFDEAARDGRNPETFKAAIDIYISNESLYRRGHVEFIYAGIKRLKEFGADKDLAVYKKIMEILPVEKMIAKSTWQIEWMHYPKQQQCCIDLMEYMEDRGLIPDHEFGCMLADRFGTEAHVFRKYQRIMYWLPKFKHANPYPIPFSLPTDPVELAVLALKRMAVDLENKVTVWKTTAVEKEPLEDTFIASSQSTDQHKLLGRHPVTAPLYVEGGYRVWLRDRSLTYFILRAEAQSEKFEPVDPQLEEENLFDWKLFFEEEKCTDLVPAFSVHEQEDGTVLAACITGTSSKDSLVTWIRYLQTSNPKLEQIPVVFTLVTPDVELMSLEKEENAEKLPKPDS